MNLKNKKKIVIFSNTAWSLWHFRLPFARRFKEAGFEVFLISPGDEKYNEKISNEFNFIHIKNLNRKGLNPFQDINLFFELISIYKNISPDIVINYTIKPNIYSSFACRFLKIKSISTVTGLGYAFIKKNILNKIVKFLYKLAISKNNNVIFSNKDDLDYFVKEKIVKNERCLILPGEGINTDFFDNSFCVKKNDSSQIVFLMISRLILEKGVKEFYLSAKIVKKKYPSTEFHLLGPFDDNPSVISKNEIDNWVNEGIVKYLGVTEDVRPFICNSDVVVLPSYYKEGLPNCLMEAMSMQKPIITTNIPGCRDLVSSQKINGFLIDVKNEKMLAESMIKFIELDLVKKEEMGKNGRVMVLEKFDGKKVSEDLLRIVSKLMV